MYATVKHAIWGAIPLSSDGKELVLGFGIFVITLLVLRRPLRSWSASVPTVLCGAAVAILDGLILGQRLGPALRDWGLFSLIAVIMTVIYRMGWGR